MAIKTLLINHKPVPIEGERNLLEVIRKANIDLPTFCYHSELSIYGACRLCMVEVEGMGLVPACSTEPREDMRVKTHTDEIRRMRKMIVELLLADHDKQCATCVKGPACQLQNLARRLGVDTVRFEATKPLKPKDTSSVSLIRDPNKCVLCGDCVRACEEIQTVGAIDFAYRGAEAAVLPSFGKDLDSVECVYCGQCARVCPTGAIVPNPVNDQVWRAIHDPQKTVLAQIAPAVRVAVGESFGLAPGTTATGQLVAALKSMGFSKVYDTSFTADLTVIEEANEFIGRMEKGEKLPQFTSCCPAWIKFAEQYYPDYIGNLSSCRSPQQMFGSLCKAAMTEEGMDRDDVVVVSIMPCTAKKYEAARPEFGAGGSPDVDYVLTTQELARMIEEAGLAFNDLEPESFDMPFGFKTGAGVIFGSSGGVSEAVLRYATEKLTGARSEQYEFRMVRGEEGLREAVIEIGNTKVSLAIVHGLSNARKLIARIDAGEVSYDLIEVMACPGGCVGGAGQPVSADREARQKRAKGLYANDKMLQLHKPQENPCITELYENTLSKPGSKAAHRLLHTGYQTRKRIESDGVSLNAPAPQKKLDISVCFGTGCYLRGSQKLLSEITGYIEDNDLTSYIEIKATFCFERCTRGPVVRIGDDVIERCTLEKAAAAIKRQMRAA